MDTPTVDVYKRILEAAVARLETAGLEGLTISSVAKLAQVSRPTSYAHFGTLDKLRTGALEAAAVRVIARITEQARDSATAADYVVEATIAARTEFRRQPALAPIAFPQHGSLLFDTAKVVGPNAVRLSREFLLPLLDFEPQLAPEMEEIAETCLRFQVSLVLFESVISRSDVTLRAYLHRRLVPALGLPPRTLHD